LNQQSEFTDASPVNGAFQDNRDSLYYLVWSGKMDLEMSKRKLLFFLASFSLIIFFFLNSKDLHAAIETDPTRHSDEKLVRKNLDRDTYLPQIACWD
jgi:hypothetical protein